MSRALGEWMDWLRILHGTYNIAVAVALAYQGRLGWRIRRERTAGGKRDFSIVKRHRTIGPALVILGILGYCAGSILILIDKGHLFAYVLHNLVGMLIAVLLAATYFISRNIRGIQSPWRTPHMIVGAIILVLYLLQLFLGLNILL